MKVPQTVREPELLLKEMRTQVVPLRKTPPPAVYTAKIEPGQTLQGRPFQDPDLEGTLKRWELMQQVQSQLSRDADGKPLGTAQYDPQTNMFVVRDTPAAQARIAQVIEAVEQSGGNVNVAPKKALDGKVTAFSGEIGLVVISIGKDDGALEGDEFTVYRGGDFVARIVLDRTDRRWSAGKVVLKKSEPRVADDVSNLRFVLPGPQARFKVVSESNGLLRLRATDISVVAGNYLAIQRNSRFVALIRVERASATDCDAVVLPGLSVGRILPEDDAAAIINPRAYLAGLPADVRGDLASRANQQSMRAKMGLKE
jgi:hypothetical protein